MHNQTDVIAANVRLHTAAADRYKDEPHYRPESRARIREIISSLQQETRGESLLDLGCGMGFIIDIARDFFKPWKRSGTNMKKNRPNTRNIDSQFQPPVLRRRK